MKKIYTCLFALFVMNTASGQGNFGLGTNVIGAGFGIGSSLGGTYGSQTPAFNVHYEHGLWEVGGPGVISLGGYLGTKTFKNEGGGIGYNWNTKWSYTVIGVRGAYHYNGIPSDKFDVYGGLMISYNIVSFSYSDNDPNFDFVYGASPGSHLGVSPYVGGRYYFTDNIGGFAEIGYGVAYLNLGVAFKF